MHALDALESVLQPEPVAHPTVGTTMAQAKAPPGSPMMDGPALDRLLAEAVEDIEQFMADGQLETEG